jgi:ABC-type Fe3+/spermidine/putrescine transport system ATPase subunit
LSETHLSVEAVHKRFGSVEALRGVTVSAGKGEFVALLGPSGCGKTTLLRILAGLERPDAGRLLLDGEDITALPANRREFGMVFQSYALFPHLTVFDNVNFGLRMRRLPMAELERRAASALSAVQLTGFESRYPRQLSGGQQQRVALARALAIEPRLLLLDEPLSNLDARLRREVRLELRALQKRLGITALFVTHDQEEALALADRIVVMQNGGVEQVGDPKNIYRAPTTAFTAAFVGEANLISARVTAAAGDAVSVTLNDGTSVSARATGPVSIGDTGMLVARQEDITVHATPGGGIPATVDVTAFLGSSTICVCRSEALGMSVRARVEGASVLAMGQAVSLRLPESGLSFLAGAR